LFITYNQTYYYASSLNKQYEVFVLEQLGAAVVPHMNNREAKCRSCDSCCFVHWFKGRLHLVQILL